MDILNLSQGSLASSGLPMQAESIAGQSSDAQTGQTATGFSDALLNVIDSLMVGQGLQPTRDITVSAKPLSLDDDDDDTTSDLPQLSDDLLKDNSQQKLLETLLMTSQMPTQSVSYLGMAQHDDDMLLANAQALKASQTLAMGMGMAPSLQQQNLAMPTLNTTAATAVDSAASVLSSSQPVSPVLMSAMTPVTPVALHTDTVQPSATVTPSSPLHTSTLKMDPEPSRWSEQLQTALGDRLQVQVKEQIQHATIRLDPPDMGKIDISMQVDNGRVQVQINASHAEVYRALQQTSNDLRQSLTEQNFVQVNVQVSSQSGGQQGKGQQQFAEQHNAIQAGADVAATQERHADDSVLLTV